MTVFRRRLVGGFGIAIAATIASGCVNVNAVLEQLSDARRLAADLLVHFTKAADAANRAVMADTDETSQVFAREAEQAVQATQQDADALKPILDGLHYSNESQLLLQFTSRFAEYRALDRKILDLAVENTNLKAQRLSFGPAQEAADAFRDSVESAARAVQGGEKWHAEALAGQAVATVREIQLLEAPHIADADEAVMTRMEKRMATSEESARKALAALAPLVPAASRPKLAAASASLDRFVELNAQVIALSRRNTNVRSLALSLEQKPKLIAACEESLRALRDALAKRGYTSSR